MKVIGILLLLSGSFAYAQVLVPLDNSVAKSGEIIIAKIEADYSTEELKQMVNQKITPVFYSMEYFEENNTFKVFVTKIPKKEEIEKQYPFTMNGFQYVPTKERAKNFITLNSDEYELDMKKKKWPYVVVAILFLGFVLYVVSFIKKKNRIKKIQKEQIAKLKRKLVNVKSREGLENIYKNRSDIKKYFTITPEENLDKVLEMIDSFQYSPMADESLIQKVVAEFEKIELKEKK